MVSSMLAVGRQLRIVYVEMEPFLVNVLKINE